jgi:peptidoglycan hydrolase-like protein with peptidoglycan-binding domain
VDSTKQSTQNDYDALGRLVFKDPAPAQPVQTAKPEGTTATGSSITSIPNNQSASDSTPPSLESRIKDWQRSLGVTPDGIIGPETIAAAAKNGFDKGVDFVKNNSTLATKVVLSALGLGGTRDPNAPNQKQIDQATALKIARDALEFKWY